MGQTGRSRKNTGDRPPPIAMQSTDLNAHQNGFFGSAPPIAAADDSQDQHQNSANAGKPAGRKRSQRTRRNVRSASWLSSILFHALGILVLLLILAPADFGGVGIQSLTITLEEEQQPEQLTVFDSPANAPLSGIADDELSSAETMMQGIFQGGIQALDKGSEPGVAGYARGSFFGIEATGHDFVYVLDVSGSMQGRRFDRASAELIRSVEALAPHQEFYVLLFSSGTTQMFNNGDLRPKSVSATLENKKRLAEWLSGVKQAGGTDPREALGIAMRMNPSAIFMLSDGEFNGRENQRKESLFGANTAAASIVQASAIKPPIHAIAFEDKGSRDNMQELAQLTQGNFRFVEGDDTRSNTKQVMVRARAAVAQGNYAAAKLFLREASANLKARKKSDRKQSTIEVSEMIFNQAVKDLEQGRCDSAVKALIEIVELDRESILTGSKQMELARLVVDYVKDSSQGQVDVDESANVLSELRRHAWDTKASKRIRDALAEMHVSRATEYRRQGDLARSVRRLEKAMTIFDSGRQISACNQELDGIAEEISMYFKNIRVADGDVESALAISRFASEVNGLNFQERIEGMLKEQARDMWVSARDAANANDLKRSNQIKQDINSCFEAELVLEVRRQMSARERRAKALFRVAFSQENRNPLISVSNYQRIVADFPDTVTASRATERLRRLGNWQGN